VPYGRIRTPPIFWILLEVDVGHGGIPYTRLLHGTATPHALYGESIRGACRRRSGGRWAGHPSPKWQVQIQI